MLQPIAILVQSINAGVYDGENTFSPYKQYKEAVVSAWNAKNNAIHGFSYVKTVVVIYMALLAPNRIAKIGVWQTLPPSSLVGTNRRCRQRVTN